VELDSEVLAAAEKWFGFTRSDRNRVHLTDGIEFMQDTVKSEKQEWIIVNLDSNLGSTP